MKSFFKTYLVVFGVLSGITAFICLLFWGAAQLFGINGPIFASIALALIVLSFGITASIENSN